MMLCLAIAAAAATPVQFWDLEQDNGGFLPGGELGQWQWGAVGGGPGAGFVGQNAWAVGLDGSYLNDSIEYLELPTLSLDGVAMPVLRFAHWYLLGAGDTAFVEVNQGFGWTILEPTYGYPSALGYTDESGDWQVETFLLDSLVSGDRVRLVFVADTSGVGAGWYVDEVGVWDGDVSPPRVEVLSQLPDTENLDGPYMVSAVLDDDVGVTSANLSWSIDGVWAGSAGMVPLAGDTWTAGIPGQLPDTEVAYWVDVTDGANTSRAPTVGAMGFRVYLPAPTDLRGPSGRVVGSEAELSWSPPSSVHAVLGYRVERAGVALLDTPEQNVVVDLAGNFDIFAVRALYAQGQGDPTDTIEVDAVVPILTLVEPERAWPGDTVRVTIWGNYLLMVDGKVALSMGEGVNATAVDVIDVDHLLADVHVEAAAAEGPREVTVTSPAGVVSLADGFVVLPEGGRPALLSLSPNTVEQGDVGELVLQTQGEIGSPATVDLGPDVIVQTVTVTDGQVNVEYAVAPNAALGGRTVGLDDGTHILQGPELVVEDYRAPSIGTCAAVPAVPAAAGLVATMVLWSLRRCARRAA